jgi:Protein of unknown function (DUF3153)
MELSCTFAMSLKQLPLISFPLYIPGPRAVLRWLARWRLVWLVLLGTLLLSGCVKSDVGITFDGPTHGTIVQHIRFGDQVTRLNANTIQILLDNLNQRARPLGGTVKKRDRQTATITIPFSTSQDLVTKFNRFLSADEPTSGRKRKVGLDLPKINSQIKIAQGNFILLERRHVVYDLDLRALGVTDPDGDVLVDANALIDLEFSLLTPWGARSIASPGSPRALTRQRGKQLVWALQPGQMNHLEAVFWMPNPIGIGTLIIAVLIGGGIYYKRNSNTPTIASVSAPVIS